MVDALKALHCVVILAVVGAYTYYMFVGFHAQSFKYAKKNFEDQLEKNVHMKRDYEKWMEEKKREEALQNQEEEEEPENEAKPRRGNSRIDKVAQMDLELKLLREQLAAEKVAQMELEVKLLREQLAANTNNDVRFVNQKMGKKELKGNNRRGSKIDEKVDMKEQARRIKHQMDNLNIIPHSKTHISMDGIKVSDKEGVHVPEDFLEDIQDYIDDPQMEDLMEDYKTVIKPPAVEDIIEDYSDTNGHYLTEEELLAAFHYVEEEPEEYVEDYDYEQDTGGFCETEAEETCGHG